MTQQKQEPKQVPHHKQYPWPFKVQQPVKEQK